MLTPLPKKALSHGVRGCTLVGGRYSIQWYDDDQVGTSVAISQMNQLEDTVNVC